MEDADREVVREEARRERQQGEEEEGEMVLLVCRLAPGPSATS